MSDGEPEPDVEPSGTAVVVLSAAEGSYPTADGGLVDAEERPVLIVVAFELQAEVVTGGVVVPWAGVDALWQTGAGEPASADAAAVWLAASSSHG